jgi:hypothetical protein
VQLPWQAPAAPVTTRTVDVYTEAAFMAEVYTPETRINVRANLPTEVVANAGGQVIRDMDIRVDPGVRVFRMYIGGQFCPITRCRVAGPTLGQNSGGSFREFIMGLGANEGTRGQDVIIEGVNFSGGSTLAAGEGSWTPFNVSGCDRVFIGRTKLHSNQSGTIFDRNQFMTVCGNNWACGAANDEMGISGARWNMRQYAGHAIYYDNDQRVLSDPDEFSFHRIRVAPDTSAGATLQYVWIGANLLEDPGEGKGLWIYHTGGNNPTDRVTAAWFEGNTAYLTDGASAVGDGSWYPHRCQAYSRSNNNTFYGDFTLAMAQSTEATGQAADKDHTTGNTYNAYQAPPAWGGVGDPTTLTDDIVPH